MRQLHPAVLGVLLLGYVILRLLFWFLQRRASRNRAGLHGDAADVPGWEGQAQNSSLVRQREYMIRSGLTPGAFDTAKITVLKGHLRAGQSLQEIAHLSHPEYKQLTREQQQALQTFLESILADTDSSKPAPEGSAAAPFRSSTANAPPMLTRSNPGSSAKWSFLSVITILLAAVAIAALIWTRLHPANP